MLLESQKICQPKKNFFFGHSKLQKAMVEFAVKILPHAGEMDDSLTPSFIDTGECIILLYRFLGNKDMMT